MCYCQNFKYFGVFSFVVRVKWEVKYLMHLFNNRKSSSKLNIFEFFAVETVVSNNKLATFFCFYSKQYRNWQSICRIDGSIESDQILL